MKLTDHVKEASQARSDLFVFAAVIRALENGTVRPRAEAGAALTGKIAEEEQSKALARFDRHIAAIEAGWQQ